MKFGIEIRNIHTGAAHVLDDLQAVANFLADKAHDEWEGFRHLGALPAPTVEAAVDTPAVSVEGVEALVDQSAAALIVANPEIGAVFAGATAEDLTPPGEPQAVVADVHSDGTVSIHNADDASPSSSEPSV